VAVLTNASVLIYTLQAIKGCGRPSRLTLARYQSGETDIEGRVSRCGEERARTALYEAAHTLLVHTRSGRAWSMKIAKLRGMARAAVARKLAVILHRVWSDETELRFGKYPSQRRDRQERSTARTCPAGRTGIYTVGTMGRVTSLRVSNLRVASLQGRETD